jgi:hypothetical protein
VFEYYICQKILLYFPSFALSVTLAGQFRLLLNSSFRLALLFVSSTSVPRVRRLLSSSRRGVQETMWDLWWIHGYCKDDFSEYFRFPVCFVPPVLLNHISLIYRRYQLTSLNKHARTLSLSPFPVSNLILPVVVYFHQFIKCICIIYSSILLLDGSY